MSNIDLSQLITAEDKAAAARTARAAGVDAERDRRILAGVAVDLPDYATVPIQGRERDQVNMLALKDTARDLTAAGITDPIMPFRDRDNAEHQLTPAQITALADAGKRYVSAIYAAAWALKDTRDIPADYRDDTHWPPGGSLETIVK